MASVQGSDDNDSRVGKKPTRQPGGMSNAISIAAGLGFSVSSPLYQNLSFGRRSFGNRDKSAEFVRLLRELSNVQRKIANLHVELQGRKEDMLVAHLTHVSEMEKKIETLARFTTVLKGAIHNKDRIIARLQQPLSIDCIPVEAEYQKQFLELLMMAASDYGTLTASVSDLQWTQDFNEPPSVWGEMLRPIFVALVSCSRYFEAMTARRESFATLQKLRVGPSRSQNKDLSQRTSSTNSECMTPHSSGNVSDDLEGEMQEGEKQEEEDEYNTDIDDVNDRRLSSPSDKESDLELKHYE